MDNSRIASSTESHYNRVFSFITYVSQNRLQMIQLIENFPRLIPVIMINKLTDAVPLAKALIKGGINTFEITLRTDAAFDAMIAIKNAFPKTLVGVGTVTTPDQLYEAKEKKADFTISPGLTASLLMTAKEIEIPYLPAVSSPSDILLAIEHGFTFLKFFPAHLSHGIKVLKVFSDVFPKLHFYPTGGIHLDNLTDYLSLPNVAGVGGSWLTPKTLIETQQWEAITQLAQKAQQATQYLTTIKEKI